MLLSKKERALQFLAQNLDWFCCPLCQSSFSLAADGLRCENHHHFDLSRKGMTYFLQHQYKTEYDKAMFSARRKMIQNGIYQPMLEAVKECLPTQDYRLLDVGCGEGSFTQRLQLEQGTSFGIDVSKEGIQLATDYMNESCWFAVADLTHLPLKSHSTDVILDLFSPAHYEEFQRILQPEGYVVKIIPAAHYLKELRQAFYHDTAKEKYSNEQVTQRLKEKMEVLHHRRITYEVPILEEWQQDVLHMSPIHWAANKQQLAATHLTKLTIDVELYVARF